jgi:TPR repeat protein
LPLVAHSSVPEAPIPAFGAADSQSLAETTLEVFRRAEQFHPAVDLPHSIYAARISELASKYRAGADSEAVAAFVQSLHTNDLYLALACSLGGARAWSRFTSLYSGFIYSQALYISRRKEEATELSAAAIANVLTPGAGGQHRWPPGCACWCAT